MCQKGVQKGMRTRAGHKWQRKEGENFQEGVPRLQAPSAACTVVYGPWACLLQTRRKLVLPSLQASCPVG